MQSQSIQPAPVDGTEDSHAGLGVKQEASLDPPGQELTNIDEFRQGLLTTIYISSKNRPQKLNQVNLKVGLSLSKLKRYLQG